MIYKDKKSIFKNRAIEIAKLPVLEDNQEYIEVLVFSLSDEKYAINTSFIEEVTIIKDLTEIPFVPPFIKGVINIRGHIYSIVDLTILFNLKKSDQAITKAKTIIIKSEDMEFGIYTDNLEGVMRISKADIKESPLGVSDSSRDYISGITSDNLIILDTSKLLSDKKMIVNQEI